MSESGRLSRGDGNQERGNRRWRVLVLVTLQIDDRQVELKDRLGQCGEQPTTKDGVLPGGLLK